MKRSWTKTAVVLGPLIIISALVWEVARMNPSFQFIVDPWAIRGYEATQGWLWVAIGVGMLIAGMLVGWERSSTATISALIVVYMVAAAIVIAVIFGDEPYTITSNQLMLVVLALVLAIILRRIIKDSLSEQIPGLKSPLAAIVTIVVAAAIFWFTLQLVALEKEITVHVAVIVAVLFIVVGLVNVLGQPRGLGSNRMLVFSSIITWSVVIFSAGALRSTLLRLQEEGTGVAAAYKDTQVGPGWFIANIGALLIFVGAVGLWARRRDLMLALMRARRQRAAAEESAREISEALETYEAESAETAAPPGS